MSVFRWYIIGQRLFDGVLLFDSAVVVCVGMCFGI